VKISGTIFISVIENGLSKKKNELHHREVKYMFIKGSNL